MIVNCENCNKEFHLRPSDIKTGKKNCSMICRNEWFRKNPNKGTYQIGHGCTGPIVFIHTEESKLKMSITRKGKRLRKYYAKKATNNALHKWRENGGTSWNKGLIGVFTKDKAMNWQGGKSFEEYGLEFNRDLKQQIRSRDKHACRNCGKHRKDNGANLDVHHIDFNKRNNSFINLISICKACHTKTTATKNRISCIKYYEDKVGISDNVILLSLL